VQEQKKLLKDAADRRDELEKELDDAHKASDQMRAKAKKVGCWVKT
jgi:hypothetical protein